MAKSVSTYLNFNGNTEDAFTFYKSVFGTEYVGDIMRMGSVPPQEGQPALTDAQKQLIIHVMLPIYAGHHLMGTDADESLGFKLTVGDNVAIMLGTETREETDALFSKLSEGGTIEMPMMDMFWGDYYGAFADKFGIRWMLNCPGEK